MLIESVTEARSSWAESLTDELSQGLRNRKVDIVRLEQSLETLATLEFDETRRASLTAAVERAGRLAGQQRFAELLWLADDEWWRNVDPFMATNLETQDRERAVRLLWYRALAHLELERPNSARAILKDSLRVGLQLDKPRAADWSPRLIEAYDAARRETPFDGVLVLQPNPEDGTEVFIDGRKVGVGRVTVPGLPPGRYRVTMRRGSEWCRTYEIRVQPGVGVHKADLWWNQDRYLTKDGLYFEDARERRRAEEAAVRLILEPRDEARALVLGLETGRATVTLTRVPRDSGRQQAVWDAAAGHLNEPTLAAIERFTVDGSVDEPLQDPRFVLCRADVLPYWITLAAGAAVMTGGAIAWGMNESAPDPTSPQPQPEFLTDGVTYGRPFTLAGLGIAAMGGAGALGCWLARP